ncbi:hypothetical protein [Bradyrhizobium sp. 930_D9_N1_4]|uniref:hypothetical protein n=1 Tax=Bradyrhizobium sp. 930_D9_N1_4 TaxID=3240374 RepID=UPI003F8B4905
MAGRFINPFPQFTDSTPDVYSGGKLYFYATGTSTPLNTYTTKALAVANPNPVVLNSAGRPAVDIFLQDLEYKVVLKDASDNIIWTADPVSHRDSLLVAKTSTGSGSPNGSVAGTAGSSSVLPDFYWDYTNSVLYVCTTTGTSSTAVWTAINASSSTPAVPPPQGRLTLTSSTPILVADVTAATAVYYTPFVGNLLPIYNGSSMIPTEFSELTLSLVSSHAANAIYDVFVFSNSGVVTIATGPAWSTATAGSGARGSGAGTTQLARVKGLWTNAVSMTARNGSTTYTVGANLGTYVGSISMDGTNGQVSCLPTYGQSRKWGVWNAYNRKKVVLQAGDATASWTYTTNTVRPSNNSTANSVTVFCGLPEENVDISFSQMVQGGSGTTNNQVLAAWAGGIGWNSTTVMSGIKGIAQVRIDGTSVDNLNNHTSTAQYSPVPFIGINVATCLEQTTNLNNASVSWTGTIAGMLMLAKWDG